MTNLLFKIFATTIFATGLVGCGGAPSEGDIKSAWGKEVAKNAAAASSSGVNFRMNLPETKVSNKIGCKEDGEKAYKCDVEMEVQQGAKTQKTPINMRLVKGSDGWTIVDVARR